MAHRIRLRQPWTRRVVGQEIPHAGKLVILERRFNRPTGIEPDDQIEVEVNAETGEIFEVRLNEVGLETVPEIQSDRHARFDLSDRLAEHNILHVHLHSSEGEPELGDVNLWITPTKNS